MMLSALETADNKIQILPYLDSDDPTADMYPIGNVSPPLPLGPAYQRLFHKAESDILMLCADDILFKTKGWDTKVKETMPKDLIGVVSCNELPKGKREHGHPFIGRRFIEIMGYICHPKLNHSCVDTWVREISEGIKRFYYLEDVITEHVHPKYGKGKLDDTYRSNTKVLQNQDGAFYKSSQSERKQIIERLSECLNGSSGSIKTNP